jgi:hypothetical protein
MLDGNEHATRTILVRRQKIDSLYNIEHMSLANASREALPREPSGSSDAQDGQGVMCRAAHHDLVGRLQIA